MSQVQPGAPSTLHIFKRRSTWTYSAIVLVSLLVGVVGFEVYLRRHAPARQPLPFYNKLYPYVMFRPPENAVYISQGTHAMSHNKRDVEFYTNEDGFRVSNAHYELPKTKPPGQLRVAFLGPSLVQLASTYETTLPGSLKTVLQKQYPGRNIEVINAGIQSAVSRQSLVELFLTVVDYHPDIVILYDGVNDIGLPLTYESRFNFPYNFQTMEEAWDDYRDQRRTSLSQLILGRSFTYRLLRAALHPNARHLVPTADEPFAGTNAVPPERIIGDKTFAQNQISAYLSNWRKLIELSKSYGYKSVLILNPAGGLDRSYSLPRMHDAFHLGPEAARKWIDAFDVLYDEAGHQMEAMRVEYPDAVFLNLTHFLKPSKDYFWDLAHLYDEANMIVAQRIFQDIKPLTDAPAK